MFRLLFALTALAGASETEGVVQRDDRTLRYRVHWPSRADRPAPLVLGLHGRPRREPVAPFHMLAIGRHDPYGEAIVVAPFIDWDEPWADTQAMILRALRDVAERREVDRRRVSVAGFSMGASSALYLARNRPQVFSAVLAASGHFPQDVLEDLSETRTRVLLSWSGPARACDETAERAREMSDRGADARAIVFPGGAHVAHLELLSDAGTWRWFVGAPAPELD